MNFVRVSNIAALFLIIMLFLAACTPADTPTAAPSENPTTTVEASCIAKPTAAETEPTYSADATSKPIEKLTVSVRRIELPQKTEGILLPCYIMEDNGWGYANERGEIVLGTEYDGGAWQSLWSGYMMVDYCDDRIDGTPYRQGIVNSHGDMVEIADYDALSEIYEENGRYYCDMIFVEERDSDWFYAYCQDQYLFACRGIMEEPGWEHIIADLEGNLLLSNRGKFDAIEYMGNGCILCYDYADGVTEGRYINVENACFVNLATGEKRERKDIECIDLISAYGWPSVYGKRTQNGEMLFGFINAGGEDIIAPQFEEAQCFYEGCAAVRRKGDKSYTYIGLDGKPLFEKQFAVAHPFSEGLAAASLDGKTYGYIDKTGEFVIPPIYDCAALRKLVWQAREGEDAYKMFHNGYALVADAEENRMTYIDKTGKELFHFFVSERDYD